MATSSLARRAAAAALVLIGTVAASWSLRTPVTLDAVPSTLPICGTGLPDTLVNAGAIPDIVVAPGFELRSTCQSAALRRAGLAGGGLVAGDRRLPRRLPNPGGGSGEAALPNTVAGRPYSFGGLTLCTNEGKKVDITGVRLGPSSTGIRISEFAVRPQPAPASDGSINMFGSAAAPLVAAGFTPRRGQ
jgi:hypothetical protein